MAIATVTVTRAPLGDRAVLARLMELCQHDYSEFDGGDVDAHGCFGYRWLDHYWTEADRHPFLVRVDGAIAGFALVREQTELGLHPVPRSVAEFFILRKYRRKGLGRKAALLIFSSFAGGPWVVGQTLTNMPAQRFWRRVVGEATRGCFREREEGDRHLLEFDLPPP